MRRRLLLIVSLLLTVTAIVPVPTQAAWEQLDQSAAPGTLDGGISSAALAQTFTAGITGDLSRVVLPLSQIEGDAWIEIRTTSAGAPTGNSAQNSGTVLASATLSSDVTVVDGVVFDSPAAIQSGVQYAIVVGTSGFWVWSNAESDYTAGQFFFCAPSCSPQSLDDRAFETYVRPPDSTAPTGGISINSDATYTNSTSVTLTLTCQDDVSGCHQMAFATDGTNFSTPIAYAATTAFSLPGGNGTRTVTARFYDEAGNQSAPSSDSIVLDTTAPTTTIVGTNPSTTPTNQAAISFVLGATDNIGPAGFECSLDDADFTACTSPTSYTELSDGEHAFEVRSIDVAGNLDPSPASYAWAVDTTAPTVTIDQASGQPDPTNSGIITFDVQFSDPVTGFSTDDIQIGGPAGGSVMSIEPLSEPASTYTVRISDLTDDGAVIASIPAGAATDAAGNTNTVSTSTDNSVTVDTTRPVTTATVTGPQGQAGWYQSAIVTLDAGEPVTTTYTIDAGDPQTYATPFPLPTDGAYTITYASIDPSGNQEQTKSITVNVDGTAPVFQPLADQTLDPTGPAGSPIIFTPVVSDNLSSDGTIAATCIDQNSNPFVSGQDAPVGVTTITCSATDLAGNTASESLTVTVLGVEALFSNIDAQIVALDLARSMERSLLMQAALAEMLANAGQPGMACMQLSVLDMSVRAQESRRRISRQDAAEIYAQTQQIRAVLGCADASR